MIWLYCWCGFIAFVVLSIPVASFLSNRPAKPDPTVDEEVIEEEAVEEEYYEEEEGVIEAEEPLEEFEETEEFEELS